MLHFVFVITLVCIASADAEIDVDLEEDFRPIPCQRPRQCMTELGIHSDCVKRSCVCVNESKYLANDTPTCFKAQLDVGGKCESTAECNITSTECRQQSCECLVGFVADAKDKSRCLAGGKLLGEPCDIDDQCESKYSGDVACTDTKSMGNTVCSCTEGHSKNGNSCYKKKSIGESCENVFNCEHIQQTTCDKICTCLKGFVPNAQNSACLSVATVYGAQCEEDIQCSEELGDDLICRDKHCECKNELKFDEELKKCIQIEAVTVEVKGEQEGEVKEEVKEVVKEELQEDVAVTDTNLPPELYPNAAKSDLPGSGTIQIRISSILLTSAVLAAQFVLWLYRPSV